MGKVVIVAALSEGKGIDMTPTSPTLQNTELQRSHPLHRPNLSLLSSLNTAGTSPGGGSFKSPLSGLRRAVTNEKSEEEVARAAQEEEEKQEKERERQKKLFRELEGVVVESKKAISWSDLTCELVIGRGKFASVHKALYNCRLHSCGGRRSSSSSVSSAVRLVRERDREAMHEVLEANANGGEMGGRSNQLDLVVEVAVKTPEYRLAPLLYPPSGSKDVTQKTLPDRDGNVEGGGGKRSDDFSLPPSVQLLETLREVRALQVLSHPNIINYFGVVLAPRLCAVLELLDSSLAEVLRGNKDNAQEEGLSESNCVLILRDVCRGLQYMHSLRFAHLDIKPHNILLASMAGERGRYTAKLADFGTAVRMEEGDEMLTTAVGTSGYTAPEISLPGRYDMRADVFSFAILMWEVLVSGSGGEREGGDVAPVNPFAGKDMDEAACDAHGGVRPSLSLCRVPELRPTVEGAWVTAPEGRLPLGNILDALDSVL